MAKNPELLFENLLTMNEFLDLMKGRFSKWSVYKWVQDGIPHKKIRSRLFFPKTEALQWLERTSSNNGNS
jgi:hypothetical protein